MIHTLTLNPALDQIFYFKQVEKNTTNRIKDTRIAVGGKGTHVSLNLSIQGIPNCAFGLSFGKKGHKIISALQAGGVEPFFIHTDTGESRTNYLLVEENGDCTLIAERGPEPEWATVEKLITLMKQKIGTGDSLIISGDASNFTNPQIYNQILKEVKHKQPRIYLDSSGETLRQCLMMNPFLIKPNREELSELAGVKLETEDQIVQEIQELERYHIQVVAVSLGGDGSVVKTPRGIYRVHPPQIHIQNTIGCGDSFLSGLIAGFDGGMDDVETLSWATAISAATAESILSVGFDFIRAKELKSLINIEQLG